MEHDHHAATSEPETHTAGSILRRCREFNRISLEEAAEATKIGKNYLRALEADRFQDLPSPAYLKGFLRTYATYLGLQTEELIQLASQQEAELPAEPEKNDQTHQSFGGFNWQRLVLPAVLLVALVVSTVFMTPSASDRAKRPTSQQTLPSVQPVAAVGGVQPVHSSVQVAPVSSTAPQAAVLDKPAESVMPPSKPRDGFMVRMKVNRNSALSVIIDDTASQGYELNSGDLIEWKAARTIALDLSDAGSVTIELNGAPLKLQVPPGKPAYIILDAHGVRQ